MLSCVIVVMLRDGLTQVVSVMTWVAVEVVCDLGSEDDVEVVVGGEGPVMPPLVCVV